MTRIFLDTCVVKLLDYNNVINYTNYYQIAFDKLLSFLNIKSWISKKTIKMTLQKNLLRYLKKNYIALVLAIEINWKDKITDLANTILRVIRPTEINKNTNKDNSDVKVLAANIHWAPKKTCTIKKYIKRGVTTYYTNWC